MPVHPSQAIFWLPQTQLSRPKGWVAPPPPSSGLEASKQQGPLPLMRAKELWRTSGPLRTAGGWVGGRGVTPSLAGVCILDRGWINH